MTELRASGVTKGLVSWNILDRLLQKKASKPRRMWIQGSYEFVSNAIKLARLYNFTTYTSAIVGSTKQQIKQLREDDTLTWSTLTHSRVGGLTKGKFSVSSSVELNKKDLYEKSQTSPRLGDVLKCTEEGIGVDDSEARHLAIEDGYLLQNSLVRFGVKDLNVIAPSVFLKGLCKRKVTDAELMNVYDMNVAVQNELLKNAAGLEESLSKTFVNQVPGKVCYRLGLSVLQSLSNTEPISTTKDESGGIGMNSDPTKKDVRKRTLDDLESTVKPSEATLVETVDLPMENSLPSDPNLKAAKNDDAKANEEEWNERAGRHLEGGYQKEIHDKPFEMMRRSCLRWYQNRVRKSFLKYLRLTYGDDWETLAHGRYRKSLSGSKRNRDGEPVTDTVEEDSLSLEINYDRYLQDIEEGKNSGRKSSDRDKKRDELIKDLKVGRDAILRAGGASWWEWDAGSTLFFWRWPEEYKKDVRDGLEVCVEGQLPEYWARQSWPEDPVEREQLKNKLHKPVIKRYIGRGFVKSLTGFFSVPKGEGDIRIVYDATKSKLNDAIWAPNFFLPSVDTVLRNSDADTYYGDIDLGEMFLNYFLDVNLRKFAGVDVTAIKDRLKEELADCSDEDSKRRVLMRWERNLMGLKSSPYNSIRTFAWSEDFIRGDRKALDNPLRWDRVNLNLPGSANYDPSKSWVIKYDEVNEKNAAFFESYIDDIRSGDCGGVEACERTTHVIAARINYLGQQDSPRKRRKVSRTPGAWSGAMIWSDKKRGIFVTTTQEKWDKAKRIVNELLENVRTSPKGKLDRKQLERDRGFLIHISRTYTQMVPYLKGIHHTLESWRFGRDEDGWKQGREDIIDWLNAEVDFDAEAFSGKVTKRNWKDALKSYRNEREGEAPKEVEPVRRLKKDLEALNLILDADEPISRLVRGTKMKKVRLMFGDASGSGFGSTWETLNGMLRFRHGLWEDDFNQASSNLRELQNLVDSLEYMSFEENMEGLELFVFTDNSTAERAFFRGSSKSEALHDLVLRLRLLETAAGCKIHMVHVAGTRMIAQGADGLSRGNLTEGVMAGWNMGDFVPLHMSALERSDSLEKWIRSWFDVGRKTTSEVLTPEGWFERGHDIVGGEKNVDNMWIPKYESGCFVWAPPPAAAETVLEQLRKARHKRQSSCHVFVCPRLMTPYWAKHLNRSADLITVVPLLVQNTGQTVAVQGTRSISGTGGAIAKSVERGPKRRWISSAGTMAKIEGDGQPENDEGLKWERKVDHDRFLRARTGDMLCSQFQCDHCWFVNLQKRLPNEKSLTDAMLMPYIRRVNLDVLWSREESTVYNNFLATRKKNNRSLDLGLTPIAWARGPWPVDDKLGFQTALEILRQSQEPGRNVATYQQFDSIRKLRTADFNEYESSVENLVDFVLFGDNGKIFKMSSAPTQSRLFTQFMKGCEKRMGRVVKQNRALSLEILQELLHNYHLELLSEKTEAKRKRFVIIFRGYLLVSYAAALRGGEGFMIEATSLCQMIGEGKYHSKYPYVLIPLMGRFKSESGERNVLLALANESKSGLKIREVVESWVKLLKTENKNFGELGPAVCHDSGLCISRVEINKEFIAGLDRIKKGPKRLIGRDVEIENSYNIYRSMRRGATSRATAVGLTEVDINMNNRWRKFELARGARPNLKMHELYTDITLAIESHVRFSYSL